MVSSGGFVVGQLLSGLLIDADLFGLSWRSVFCLSVVIGTFAAIGAMVVLPNLPARGQRIDVLGMVMISLIGLGTLYPVIQSRNEGWGTLHVSMVVSSVVALGLFLVYQQHRARRGLPVLGRPGHVPWRRAPQRADHDDDLQLPGLRTVLPPDDHHAARASASPPPRRR